MKGFGKGVSDRTLLGYVLFQPKHSDYLVSLKAGESMTQTSWSPHPSEAKVFKKESIAKQAAVELVRGKGGYELVLCRLFETEDQYLVEPGGTFFGKFIWEPLKAKSSNLAK